MPTYARQRISREDVFATASPALPTGVPAFVGRVGPGGSRGAAADFPVELHRYEEFAAWFEERPESYLPAAVAGFFANGGARCWVVRVGDAADPVLAFARALSTLGALADVDLVAAPDAVALPALQATQIQRAVLLHCAAHGDRLAILDALRTGRTAELLAQREAMAGADGKLSDDVLTALAPAAPELREPIPGALYRPWIVIRTVAGTLRAVPPCGHVAGVFARSDARAGPSKAPANEELAGALDLDADLDDEAARPRLEDAGFNTLRAFRGRAIRVYGARTLSRDPDWRHVNVRRTFLTLRRWIDRNMSWAAFEPNEPRLWVRIRRELTSHLTRLWRDGALAGDVPEQAFYVKCDAETNPAERAEQGAVVTEIWLAPSAPAEFVKVRVVHREASLAVV